MHMYCYVLGLHHKSIKQQVDAISFGIWKHVYFAPQQKVTQDEYDQKIVCGFEILWKNRHTIIQLSMLGLQIIWLATVAFAGDFKVPKIPLPIIEYHT